MSVLARRLFIVTLICANFAILFAAVASQPNNRGSRHGLLPSSPCQSSFGCGVSL
ncbi:hypothetical protein LH464_10370 [Neorhizobium sp. T786]|uniref:hypothetical protein n=1 Tax=Pseudorhizobium xiangyangii TaxID=2883104 RepID=UPI001CFFF502|nr:hypothetical protein [Neorhizobium xiangyangii]MCB5202874.1 hypothetical protein [Neorhizobium xiangyangii]